MTLSAGSFTSADAKRSSGMDEIHRLKANKPSRGWRAIRAALLFTLVAFATAFFFTAVIALLVYEGPWESLRIGAIAGTLAAAVTFFFAGLMATLWYFDF